MVPNSKRFKTRLILSPGLFNLDSEYIIKMGGVGDMVTGTGKVT
jgi:hypothetical protein